MKKYNKKKFVETLNLQDYCDSIGTTTKVMYDYLKEEKLFDSWQKERNEFQYEVLLKDEKTCDNIKQLVDDFKSINSIVRLSGYPYKVIERYLLKHTDFIDLDTNVKSLSSDIQDECSEILDDSFFKLLKTYRKKFLDRKDISIKLKRVYESLQSLMLSNGLSSLKYEDIFFYINDRPSAGAYVPRKKIIKLLGETRAKREYPQLFKPQNKLDVIATKYYEKIDDKLNKNKK